MKLYWRKKYLLFNTHNLWVGIVIASAAAIRIILIALGWPLTNSDEGTMGLMALHIAFRGEHPIFFYGQSYMGALEAYIASPLFRLFGPSLFTLRFGLVLLFIAFLLIAYLLIRILYNREYALLSITLLCFGSTEMLTRQLKAVGGAVETMLFGCLILLLTTHLLLPQGEEDVIRTRKSRSLLYSFLGLAMGLGIWSHMLVLPFVGVSFLLLFFFCRAEWKTRSFLFLVLGLFIGLLPSIIFSLENPLQNSISTLITLRSTGGVAVSQPYSFWDDLLGTILISIPMATGSPNICTVSTTPGQWREQLSSCMIIQGSWGIGYFLLFLLACLLAIKNFRAMYHCAPVPRSINDQRNIVLHTMRIAVLVSALLTLLIYMLSPAPALVPVTSSRYLVGLLVAFPVILASLWNPLQVNIAASRINSMLKVGRIGFLIIGVLLVWATWNVFQQVPEVQKVSKQPQILISDLEHLHINHIYSDYWTCDNIIFQSDEHIICSAIDENLQPGQNRYMPYTSIVQQDPQAAYVFPIGSPQVRLFMQKFGQMKKSYSMLTLDGYAVFQKQGP